jgi:hypothetical protein
LEAKECQAVSKQKVPLRYRKGISKLTGQKLTTRQHLVSGSLDNAPYASNASI